MTSQTDTAALRADLDRAGHQFIEVEKMLCALLGRKWAPSGFSIETLCRDIGAELDRLRSPPTDAQVERAAIAICGYRDAEYDGMVLPWTDVSGDTKDECRALARAALQASREEGT